MKALDLIDWAMQEAQQLNPDHLSPSALERKPALSKLLEMIDDESTKQKPDGRSNDNAAAVDQVLKQATKDRQQSYFTSPTGMGSDLPVAQAAQQSLEPRLDHSESALLKIKPDWPPAARLEESNDQIMIERTMAPHEAAFVFTTEGTTKLPQAAATQPANDPAPQTEQTKALTEIEINSPQTSNFDHPGSGEVRRTYKAPLVTGIPSDLQTVSAPIVLSIDAETLAPSKTPLQIAIESPGIYTSRMDRSRAVALRWTLRDIRGNRLKLSPVDRNDLLCLIDMGLVEMLDDVPALTNAGQRALSRR
jgi:hypothetical protein